MAESVELPSRLGILPFKNKILLPGAIIRIRCTSPASVKLVEQELWQREDKGVIGILPVRDAAEAATVASVISQGVGTDFGERSLKVQAGVLDAHKHDGKNQQEVIHWHTRAISSVCSQPRMKLAICLVWCIVPGFELGVLLLALYIFPEEWRSQVEESRI